MLKFVFKYGIISILAFFVIYCNGQRLRYINQFVVWCDEAENGIPGVLKENVTIEKLNISGYDCLYLVTDMSKPKGSKSVEQDTDTMEKLRAQPKNGAISPSMKVQEAWNLGYNGSGITIAVIDDGVQITHTDLDANMKSGYHYDYVSNDADPDPRDGNDHGTRCTGLIVAEANNNECVVGVAYGAQVIGIRLLSSSGSTDLQESKSLSHQRSVVDIYTNSWGPPDGYGFFEPGSLTKAELQNGVTLGRSGKGAIFTWAAGNGYHYDNCNGDGYVNSIYTIGVTSLDSTGKPAFYSEVCAAAMATTYGGSSSSRYLYSTSRSDGCTSDLQGTSFATPVAAGIIALALQANPNLNWRDVQHLIVLTSKKYSLSDSYYSWQLNGAKKYVHPRLGFGLMDAQDMVKYSSNWTQVPSQVICQSSTSSPNLRISAPNIVSVTDSITIGSGCSIQYLEHVQIEISFQSQSIGHVELTLISPSGTNSYLMTKRYQDYFVSSSYTWTFMTVQHWGEAPQGQWNLKMINNVNLYSGNLYTWKLKFYGTQTDPLPNIDVCSSSPCTSGNNCTGNNYEYECTSNSSGSNGSKDSNGYSTSIIAAIVGAVIGAAVVLGILIVGVCKVAVVGTRKVSPTTAA
ncbi:hypothetical protein CHS0354_011730 [Potamilus streckersoni]|uniref:P/Homo B domain-containing protein n=1 Tax=Potamilus streckersoni TaxID=2493646 RepID=A0AAE0SK09_9BIVA|nr:hypothetical protein CHS0354_011730 [Potamilus streckersoni]